MILTPSPFTSVCVHEGRSGLAWLACGPHLEVVHAVTGERLSAYRFSGGAEQPPSVLAARDFSWLKRSELCFTFYLFNILGRGFSSLEIRLLPLNTFFIMNMSL